MRTLKGGNRACRSNNCGFIGHRVTRGSESWGCQRRGTIPARASSRAGGPSPRAFPPRCPPRKVLKSTIRHALWVLCWKEPCPGRGYPLLPEEQVNIAKGQKPSSSPRGVASSPFNARRKKDAGGSVRKDWASDYLGFIPAPSLGQEGQVSVPSAGSLG